MLDTFIACTGPLSAADLIAKGQCRMFGAYRFYLTMFVVLVHYAFVPPIIGYYMVFAFFVLSGYLMTFIMHRSYGYTARGIGKYSLNRLLRIYPLYWVSCLVAVLVLLTLEPAYLERFRPIFVMPETLVQWVKNITLILEFGMHNVLISPAWALTVELFFYLCIGLGLSSSKKISVAWFLASICYTIYMLLTGVSLNIRYHTLGAASLPFSMGAVIYHWREELSHWLEPLNKYAYSPFVIFLLAPVNWLIAYFLNTQATWGFYLNLLIVAATVINLSNRKEIPFLSRANDSWLGDLTYPMYLIHYPLAIPLLYLYQQIGLKFYGPNIYFFLISLPFIFFLSWLLVIAVERPIESLRNSVKRTI